MTNKYFIYAFVGCLFLFILSNNLIIKSAAAEDLGKKSILYSIANRNEFGEVVEEIVEETSEEADFPQQKNEGATTTVIGFSDTILAKDQLVTGSIPTTSLQEIPVANSLAAEAIQKSSSVATVSTPQPRQGLIEYTVMGGDTISTIAEKFGVSINTILWANDISGLSIIRPGKKLTILPVTGVLHKVKSGDTMSAIAKKYDSKQEEILSFNNLVSNDQLSINQLLIVPNGQIQRTYSSQPSPTYASVSQPASSQKKAGGFIWPTTSRIITQYYHWRHHGLDVGGRTGNPLYASKGGTVITAGWTNVGYGNYVVLDHGNGQKTLYAHMSKIYVTKGDVVQQGVVLGAMGSTGWSTGPHLHFEIIINGTKVNPLTYL